MKKFRTAHGGFAFVQGQINDLVRRNTDRPFEERIAMAFGAIHMAYALEVITGDEFDTLIDIYVKYKQRRQL